MTKMDNTILIAFLCELIEVHIEKCDENEVGHWCADGGSLNITKVGSGPNMMTITFSDGFTARIDFIDQRAS